MILLADANILITLHDVGGVPVLSQLGETEILDLVFQECEHASQPDLPEIILDSGIRVVETQHPWIQPAQQYQDGPLSFADALCLYYAKEHNRTLISGDRPLRSRCQSENVDFLGLIWIVRQTYERGLLPGEDLCRWISSWSHLKRRLPTDEMATLEADLGC